MYNGAFGFPMDRESQKAYEQFVRQQERYNSPAIQNDPRSSGIREYSSYADIQEVAPQPKKVAHRNRRGKAVQFEMPDPAELRSMGSEARSDRSDAQNVTVGALGLYGQLPEVARRRTSPLDSPDNLRQITFATEGADFDPDIDPTGTLLIYASTQHRATADLYLKRISGNALQQLTDDPANDVMPSFSPDGNKIAFASDRAGNWDIYIMNVTGGQAIQLTNDQTHDLSPSFSPDGRQLVYCTYGTQSGQWELVVIDVENPVTKRFVGYGLFPEWSPIDNRIVFQRARERGTRWFSIWTIEMVNGEGVRPTEIAASSNAAAIAPSWNPDATRLAFSTVIDPDSEHQVQPIQADIWFVNANGSGRTNLTNSQFANVHPVWSNNGSIYFVSNRARRGVENIWSIRPDRALRVYEPVTESLQPTAMAPPARVRMTSQRSDIDNSEMMLPTQ